jgi:hypothetical protein
LKLKKVSFFSFVCRGFVLLILLLLLSTEKPHSLTFEQGLHRAQERDLRVGRDGRGGVLQLPGEGPLGRRRRSSGGDRRRRAAGGGLLLLPKVLGPGGRDDEPADRQDRGGGVEGGRGAQGEGLDKDVGEEAGW